MLALEVVFQQKTIYHDFAVTLYIFSSESIGSWEHQLRSYTSYSLPAISLGVTEARLQRKKLILEDFMD